MTSSQSSSAHPVPAWPASRHPAAAGLDFAAEIARQSAAFADAAEGNLAAPVEHCPGWSVATLVNHLREVQWFWATIAAERLSAPPAEDREPPTPPEHELLDAFRAGALHLVEVLREADLQAPCWTWAPGQQDVGFVARHQVQEAAVHRWDAEHAAGRGVTLDTPLSVDAIEEFLTFSMATPGDSPATPRPALDGALVLQATEVEAAWTVWDADQPGTVQFERGARLDTPTVAGTSSDLLLWLYHRVDLPISDDAAELVDRFAALSFTD